MTLQTSVLSHVTFMLLNRFSVLWGFRLRFGLVAENLTQRSFMDLRRLAEPGFFLDALLGRKDLFQLLISKRLGVPSAPWRTFLIQSPNGCL